MKFENNILFELEVNTLFWVAFYYNFQKVISCYELFWNHICTPGDHTTNIKHLQKQDADLVGRKAQMVRDVGISSIVIVDD